MPHHTGRSPRPSRRATARALALFVAVLIAPAAPYAAPLAAQAPARAPLLVDDAWLASHLDDTALVILQVGSDSSFRAAHVPGAQPVALDDISTPRVDGKNYLELPGRDVLEAWGRRVGLRDDSRIVVVSASPALQSATRVLLTLEYLGLGARASLLDGTIETWRVAGRPLATGAATAPRRAGTFTARSDSAWIATMRDVDGVIAGNGSALIDARLSRFYEGNGGGYPRAGHIPTAVNVPLDRVAENGRIAPLATLRSLFEAAGVKPGQPVVAYCHIGQQATLLWYVARLLGHEARVYDGSFQEWSGSDRPVVAPATPR